ncbi:MAG TPA: GNAT family N-acetyltransferase [Acetobacteraceae bacterium]|nr:GNAT family N-acetyltransferase [Acetobacteraceae bacterium]
MTSAGIDGTSAAVHFEFREDMEFDELQAMWLDLEQRSAPHVFLSWDWIGCWMHQSGLRPVVIIGRTNDTHVLLGVLTPRRRRDVLPLVLHGLHLHMTGDPRQDVITTEYNGFLVDRHHAGKLEPQAIAFLLSGIVIRGQRRDELHMKNVVAASESLVAGDHAVYRVVQRKPSWSVDLAAIRAAGRQYLDCLSANTRQQIRRSMRLYEKRGPLVARRATNPAQALCFLDGLKELHQRYWSGRGEPGGFSFPFFEGFHRRLIPVGLPHGTVEIVRISAGSFVIGYIYNLLYRGHVYAYQSGFNYEGDPRLKPGLVSHSLCISRHLGDGSRVYDFLAGEHRYKASLGQPGPDMIYLLIERPTLPLRLENALHGMKRFLAAVGRRKRIIPASVSAGRY